MIQSHYAASILLTNAYRRDYNNIAWELLSLQEGALDTSFSIVGLRNPTEVAIGWQAIEQYRQAETASPAQTDDSPAGELDGTTAELAGRIHKGLTWHKLGPVYADIFQALLDTPKGQEIKIESLASKVGATVAEVKARLAKLSGRMKRIATPGEIARVRTPFLLFSDIEYGGVSTQYRLTQAGREAARRYLGQ